MKCGEKIKVRLPQGILGIFLCRKKRLGSESSQLGRYPQKLLLSGVRWAIFSAHALFAVWRKVLKLRPFVCHSLLSGFAVTDKPRVGRKECPPYVYASLVHFHPFKTKKAITLVITFFVFGLHQTTTGGIVDWSNIAFQSRSSGNALR